MFANLQLHSDTDLGHLNCRDKRQAVPDSTDAHRADISNHSNRVERYDSCCAATEAIHHL
jgi:hypothetical protein